MWESPVHCGCCCPWAGSPGQYVQRKTTLTFHLIPVRTEKINKTIDNNAEGGGGKEPVIYPMPGLRNPLSGY